MAKFSASLSRAQQRAGYCVIFRHPVRRDRASGKPGLKVRKGLGTRDLAEAERLKDQLNELLQDPVYWSGASINLARGRFDQRVVSIFFDQIAAEPAELTSWRESAIPLPPPDAQDCPRVLIIGPSGAGKTSLICQFAGITEDHNKAGALATSAFHTTAHEAEIFIDPQSNWRAALTFTSSDEVREHVNECVLAAALAAAGGKDRRTVLDRLLRHADQRIRFDLMLGTDVWKVDLEDEELEAEYSPVCADEQYAAIDVEQTRVVLSDVVSAVMRLGQKLAKTLKAKGNWSGREETHAFKEEFEQQFDIALRDDPAFHAISADLMKEIGERFKLLIGGTVANSVQGWPLGWHGEWPAKDAGSFFRLLSPLLRNQYQLRGRLLSPLVNGARMAGPFAAKWIVGDAPKLIFLDGVGLSGARDPSASVPTVVSRQMHEADAILLVVNAATPPDSALLALLRELVVSGNTQKLFFVYTHFDQVQGDGLANVSAKAQHILAATDDLVTSIGEELGPNGATALRNRLHDARYFLSNIHRPLSETFISDRQTIKQLRNMLSAIKDTAAPAKVVVAHPEYDRLNLSMAVCSAADSFQRVWRSRLGIEASPEIPRETWLRVRALCRKLGYGIADEYESLRPIADIRLALLVRMYRLIHDPSSWNGAPPSAGDKQLVFDRIAQRLSARLTDLLSRRLWRERMAAWRSACEMHGDGAANRRARKVNDEVLDAVTPEPYLSGLPGHDHLIREVLGEFEAALEDLAVEPVSRSSAVKVKKRAK